MKKKLCLMLAVIMILASLLCTAAVFADDQPEEKEMHLNFYWSLMGINYNGLSLKFDADRALDFYYSDEYPGFLDNNPFQYLIKDENGNTVQQDEDGTWNLTKGYYKLYWDNRDKIAEELQKWSRHDVCEIFFPEEEYVEIYVDGEKSRVSFWMCPSSTRYIAKNTNYYFDPSSLWVIQFDGVYDSDDYYQFYELFNESYSFDVMDQSGHHLTPEELAQPMKEGSYRLTWNNTAEMAEKLKNCTLEVLDRYTVEFPEEELTTVFTLSSKSRSERPTEEMWFMGFYGRNEGQELPKAEDLITFSDIDLYDKESYPDWIKNVVIEYYNENGEKLDDAETVGGMAAGVYTAKWANYTEMLAQDQEMGWGIQSTYNCEICFGDERPECTCEFYKSENDQLGSAFGDGNLAILFGFSTIICLAVIIALVIKIKKMQETQLR